VGRWIGILAGLGLVAAIGVPMVVSYSSGAGNCTYPDPFFMSPSQSGTGGFVVEVAEPGGPPVAAYLPGEVYDVTLRNTLGTAYKGFLIQSVRGAPGAPDTDGVGTFQETIDHAYVFYCAAPFSSLTHGGSRVDNPVTEDSFVWTAPEAGTGPVTFHAVGVVSLTEWYGEDTLITTTLQEDTTTAVPSSPSLLTVRGVSPNPSNPRTVLEFELGRTGRARVEIFDARGRLVRRLADETFGAGTVRRAFDGLDDAGRPLPSGVYFHRVRAHGRQTA